MAAYKAVLLLVLVLGVLFAWRAWRGLPALAVFAAVAAAVAGVLMFRSPFLLLIGLAAAGLLIAGLSRRKQ